MGLIDLRSDLSWYGNTPPQVNNLRNEDAIGFTTGNNQVGGVSEFQGIGGQAAGTGLSYTHTGIQGLGVLNETNFFLNGDHRGFRSVRQPGDQSDYAGVNSITLRYTHTGNQGLGDLAIANSFGNDDAIGFSTLSRPLQDTEFQGVDSAQSLYVHSGVQGLGNIASVNYFQNLNAIGFTNNRQQQADSEFIGVDTVQRGYTYTGTRGLGDLSRNLRPIDGLGNPERNTFVRGAVGNYTTRYSQTGGATAQLGVISADVKGFAFQGVSELAPLQKTAADAFPINSVTFSQQGVSSRSAQLGSGTKFPIGPAGQVHEFDIVRTGFSGANRYGDVYGPKSNSGLANTYTIDSPIDDMYNKFKVRDEAYNPFSFRATRHPLILRGIQRDDNSDPQRFGLAGTTGGSISGTFDIPRGGLLTFAERTALDVARLGKYAISPEGLLYLTKQFGLQLTNPNVEAVDGFAKRFPRLTQLYDPTSFILNAATAGIGIKFDRHGIPLGLFPRRGKYEQVHKDRRHNPIFDETDSNRLNRIYKEFALDPDNRFIVTLNKGDTNRTMTAGGGPRSMLGIGRTRITRGDVTDRLESGNGGFQGFVSAPSDHLGFSYIDDIKGRQNTVATPYVESGKNRSDIDDGDGIKLAAVGSPGLGLERRKSKFLFAVPQRATRIYHDSLKKSLDRNELWLDNTGVNTSLTDDENLLGGGPASSRQKIDGSSPLLDNNISKGRAGGQNWVTMNYDKLRDAASKRSTSTTTLLNFQLMARGVDVDNAEYDRGIILGEDLLRYEMYQPGKSKVVDSVTDTSPTEDFKDLITFKVGGVQFEAYIRSISDSSSPGLAATNDAGVLLPRYRPESYSREISVEFSMIATNPDHLSRKWTKLSQLMSVSQPIKGKGTVTKLTIGDLYKDLTCVCTGVEVGWDEETTWEIIDKFQVPIVTNVSITFNVLSGTRTFDVDPNEGLKAWTKAQTDHIGS